MERTSGNPLLIDQCSDYEDACDLDALLHPAQAFEHPSDVVSDPDLTLNEKARDPGVMGLRRVRNGSGASLAVHPRPKEARAF